MLVPKGPVLKAMVKGSFRWGYLAQTRRNDTQTMQASGGRIPGRGKTKGEDPETAAGGAMRTHLADWGSSKEARKPGAGGRRVLKGGEAHRAGPTEPACAEGGLFLVSGGEPRWFSVEEPCDQTSA